MPPPQAGSPVLVLFHVQKTYKYAHRQGRPQNVWMGVRTCIRI